MDFIVNVVRPLVVIRNLFADPPAIIQFLLEGPDDIWVVRKIFILVVVIKVLTPWLWQVLPRFTHWLRRAPLKLIIKNFLILLAEALVLYFVPWMWLLYVFIFLCLMDLSCLLHGRGVVRFDDVIVWAFLNLADFVEARIMQWNRRPRNHRIRLA